MIVDHLGVLDHGIDEQKPLVGGVAMVGGIDVTCCCCSLPPGFQATAVGPVKGCSKRNYR